MRQTFSISFYCRESKVGKKGVAPVEISITINGKRSYIALPLKLSPVEFKKKMNSKRGNDIKEFTNIWYSKVNGASIELLRSNKEITTDAIKQIVFNVETKKVTLLDAWKNFMAHLKKRVDVEIDLATYKKYMASRKYTCEWFGENKDINELTYNDLDDFYLHLQKIFSLNNASKHMSKLKAVLKYNDIVEPFKNIKIKKEVKDAVFLTKEEVDKIAAKDLHCERLNNVRDLFLFQCYTALSFSDMMQLTTDDIKDCEQGQYVRKQRQKTNVYFTFLILPQAKAILEKYNYQLPRITNQKCNAYLKEIADLCGIKKRLTTHCGRHTAACMFLNAGLSLDEVQKILGHSSPTMTLHYAKMLDITIFNEMKNLSL